MCPRLKRLAMPAPASIAKGRLQRTTHDAGFRFPKALPKCSHAGKMAPAARHAALKLQPNPELIPALNPALNPSLNPALDLKLNPKLNLKLKLDLYRTFCACCD